MIIPISTIIAAVLWTFIPLGIFMVVCIILDSKRKITVTPVTRKYLAYSPHLNSVVVVTERTLEYGYDR